MRNRLLLILVGVVALVLAIHDVPLAAHLERVETDRLATKLERDAFIIAGRAEEALEGGTAASELTLRALVDRYAADENVRVVIVDAGARGVVGSDAQVLDEDFSNRPEIESALALGQPTTGERFSQTLGEDLFFVAVPVLSGVERVGAVRITAPERVISERVDDRVRGLLFVAVLSLLIAVGVAWVFARSVTRPMRRLQLATDRLAAGQLDTRADDTTGPPEVRALATSFNSMASRLGLLVDRQRAFAGVASHQLRTPLTALRLRLDQVADQIDEDAEVTRSVDAAIVETDRLHRMIEGLLALSRAEDAAAGPVEVDLTGIVRERVVHWAPLVAERGIELDVDLPEAVRVLAVAGSVEQIIDNLIDNALDASPDGSTLSVSIVTGDNVSELHVIDEGPGMTHEERSQAFQRFWRGTDAAVGGSGLGLAIVHQLVEAADGAAELRSAPSGGIDAVVWFRVP